MDEYKNARNEMLPPLKEKFHNVTKKGVAKLFQRQLGKG